MKPHDRALKNALKRRRWISIGHIRCVSRDLISTVITLTINSRDLDDSVDLDFATCPIDLSEDQRPINLRGMGHFSPCHIASLPRPSIAMQSDGSYCATSPAVYKIFKKIDF